jgi:hypothetical protein
MVVSEIRAALFVDFENLYATLKRKLHQGEGDFGVAPYIDFEYLVEYIQAHFGRLAIEDFIVAANFAHYNQQLGGLNRLATLVKVDSFEPRQVRSHEQHSPGKRHVIPNFSDMALAFETGQHIIASPADVYIFVTGDASFAAIASAIRDSFHRQVVFLLPDIDSAAQVLKERFTCLPFIEAQPDKRGADGSAEIPASDEQSEPDDPFVALLTIIKTLRREFSTAIPVDLIKAMLGPTTTQRQLEHARSTEKVDLWESEGGVACISLREERVVGKIIKMEPRQSIVTCARLLYGVAQASLNLKQPIGMAEWRKILKENAHFSNAEAKLWVERLFEKNILKHGQMGALNLGLETVLSFVREVEQHEKS